jgi:predicted nucleic acid-binding protein
LIDALLPTPRREAALAALAGCELWAPGILDLEVMSAVWRLARAGEVSADEAERAVAHLRTAPIRRVTAAALAPEAWVLRESFRIADAFYIAAARLLEADLVTSDARLSRAPTLGVTVVLLR